MTRRIIIALMAYTIGISCISAQNSKTTDANIGGHVLDTESGEHMPGCVIRILGTSLATVTDASGHYIFRIYSAISSPENTHLRQAAPDTSPHGLKHL